jgi:HEAT repeat protein
LRELMQSTSRLRRAAVPAVVLVGLALAACEDVSHGDIGDEINILVRRNDQLVGPATERLAAYRRAAVPQIETAMHTAAPSGRLHLVAALDRIGDDEAVPVLRHVAVFDVTPDVRDGRARAALEVVARKRAAGLGPVLFGTTGMPGVPSTVGAPEPVGPTQKP